MNSLQGKQIHRLLRSALPPPLLPAPLAHRHLRLLPRFSPPTPFSASHFPSSLLFPIPPLPDPTVHSVAFLGKITPFCSFPYPFPTAAHPSQLHLHSCLASPSMMLSRTPECFASDIHGTPKCIALHSPWNRRSFAVFKTSQRCFTWGLISGPPAVAGSVQIFYKDSIDDPMRELHIAKKCKRLKEDEFLFPGRNSDPSTLSFLGKTSATTSMVAIGPHTNDITTFRLASGDSLRGIRTNIRALPAKVLRVAVDVDEVLGSFLLSLNAFVAEEHSQDYTISQYHVYDFMKIWRCSQAEANNRVHAFFESDHFKDGIRPIPGAYESLLQLSDFCHLVIVTSRQHVIRNQTLDWIEKHYPGIFQDVYFGNHFALEGEARPKSEICRSIGAEVLIDDNPRYAVECAQHGIEVLLFDHRNSYPWSKTPDGPVHPLITRVQDWEEVEKTLLLRVHEEMRNS